MSFAPGWRGTDVIARENELKHRNMKNRRNIIIFNYPAETAIREAIIEVEKLPADENLTKAVELLLKANELVSDFIDAKLNE